MDKTTKELRARLRTELAKWLDHALKCRAASDKRREASRQLHLGDELQLMNADRTRRIDVRLVLEHLAEHPTIGLLVSQLEERRPLKVVGSIVPENPYTVAPDSLPAAEWTIARPGRDSPLLPQTIDDPLIVWDIVVEAIIPEWLDYLSEDASPVAQAPKLGKQARAVLELLYREKAFDEAHACNLSKRAPTQLRYESAKSPDTKDKYAKTGAAELKRLRLSEAVPNVGTWLTSEGRALAESLFGQKPR